MAFTAEDRTALRDALLKRAAADARITGAAITGSGAAGKEDEWSDIDLAFGVGGNSGIGEALKDWTAHMYGERGALHHVDVQAGAWTYRVFLVKGGLQVDLAFVAEADFRALAPTFRLVSGRAKEPWNASAQEPGGLIGMAWLYALHARSSIARAKVWQAEYMVSGLRDHVLALACLRHKLATAHGRGFDQLPAEVLEAFGGAVVRGLDRGELTRAFRAAVDLLAGEIRWVDAELAERIVETVRGLALQ